MPVRLPPALAALAAAVALAAGGWALLRARADDAGVRARSDAATVHPLTRAVTDGAYHRLDTAHGPVHVWAPGGYHADGAATIVYVHGYYTEIDQAWSQHQLPEQFALAGLDAVFIAPAAPRSSRPAVNWPSLSELLAEVFDRTGLARPAGPVIAVGHSGAYRTLMTWLEHPLLERIVLVDALYGEIEPFRTWLLASPEHRLIDVSNDTLRWSEELARDVAAAGAPVVESDRFPPDERHWPDGARDARLLLVRSQHGHMPLVQGGVALPMILRLLPVEILADAPWQHPLGELPPLAAGATAP